MLLASATCFAEWAVKLGLVRFIWEPADPLLQRMVKINILLFRLNDTLVAHFEALTEIEDYLEQLAVEPHALPDSTPSARLYQTCHEEAPPQVDDQTFAHLFRKRSNS